MKLTCDRSALVDKLAILSRGVSTRLVLPVLSGIMLQASEGHIELFSTDMEISIRASLGADIEQEGEIVLPARLFSDIVRNLPGDKVTVEAVETTADISAGQAKFSLNAWSASDFPQTSTFDMTGSFVVGREPFVETLNKVGRAASRDETRPILTGVLMTIAGDQLRMVATDSYRLAVKETKLADALPSEVQAIVPVKALGEVARLAGSMGTGDLEVAIGENQALFRLSDEGGEVFIASRLVEGQFPSYRQLIPDSFDHEVTLAKDEFVAAARRVSLLAQKNAPLRLTFSEHRLTMKALTQDVGHAEESLDIEFDAESFEIGFNPAYLVDGIEALDDPAVLLRFTNPLRPGLISGADGSFTYLIMPIRLSS
jgi:DNA polymerase III subunit beta